MQRHRGDALLWGAMAIPLAYEGVRILVLVASWLLAVDALDRELSTQRLWALIIGGDALFYLLIIGGFTATAAALLLACASLLSDWRPRWLWVLVAGLCAAAAVVEASFGSFDARWAWSAHTAIQVYAVVLSVALLLGGRPAKLTSASS